MNGLAGVVGAGIAQCIATRLWAG